MKTIQLSALLVLILISFTACNFDEKIMLPQVATSEVIEMADHSPIYFFYRESDKDTLVEINKNNVISTTNWIFNIDKRLPLKTVVPELSTFFKKKRGASAHKNEESAMYFSYSDSVHQNLAFLPIANTAYAEKIYHSKTYIKQYPDFHTPYYNVSISFLKNGLVNVDGNLIKTTELQDFVADFILFSSESKPILLYLNFDQDLTFDEYVKYKFLTKKMLSDKIQISPTEFIYDKKQVLTKCDCKL